MANQTRCQESTFGASRCEAFFALAHRLAPSGVWIPGRWIPASITSSHEIFECKIFIGWQMSEISKKFRATFFHYQKFSARCSLCKVQFSIHFQRRKTFLLIRPFHSHLRVIFNMRGRIWFPTFWPRSFNFIFRPICLNKIVKYGSAISRSYSANWIQHWIWQVFALLVIKNLHFAYSKIKILDFTQKRPGGTWD